MFCPFCHTEYEAEAPCFCHPTPRGVVAVPQQEEPVPGICEQPPVGLDNPFWKPDLTIPVGLPSDPRAAKAPSRPFLRA